MGVYPSAFAIYVHYMNYIIDIPDTTYTFPAYYKESFFSGNELFHPELFVKPYGMPVESRPFFIWQDDWIILLLLLFTTITISIYFSNRKYYITQLKNFFLPPFSVRTNETYAISPYTTLLLFATLCLIGTLLYTSVRPEFLTRLYDTNAIYTLLGTYVACWAVYFLFKQLLFSFVSWIFFTKKQRQEWSKGASFITLSEVVILLPLTMGILFSRPTPQTALLLVVGVLLFIKLLLIYRYHAIFFCKIHCILHLFVYFCTLELTPLLIIWVALAKIITFFD